MASLENEETSSEGAAAPEPFKKPILIGKIGKLPRKMKKEDIKEPTAEINEPETTGNVTPVAATSKTENAPQNKENKSTTNKKIEETPELPYKEPSWGGLPETTGKKYCFEVLKNGSIIENIDLMSKSFWVLGRLPSCDIVMQHPTVSRYHAILQYRREGNYEDGPGFYIFDLGSTHGTFVNKGRVKPRVYGKIHVGHMLNLGCSTRTYILNGPDEDEETESPFTVTELKRQKQEKIQKQKEEEERLLKLEEQRGIDWGLGEDADEETDISENPYAQTNNEELYLENPKKALRGFFEREGLELEYDCSEQGYGQFLCKVELPIDDDRGHPIFAEVLHKGKKKEAVVQCALEACRILDRHGLLRQATHESRKRKPKNWEENDYYDSDEDTFLDRTGTIEKKREMRMKGKVTQKVETYESLMKKEKDLSESINKLEREISNSLQEESASHSEESAEEDSLDTYMKELKENKRTKKSVAKLKAELSKLRKEHESIVKLLNIARPTSLPPLIVENPSFPSTSKSIELSDGKSKAFPLFGKPKRFKLQIPEKSEENVMQSSDDEEEEEEEKEEKKEEKGDKQSKKEKDEQENNKSKESIRKLEEMLDRDLPPVAEKFQEKMRKILHAIKKLALHGERRDADWRALGAKKRKVFKLISNLNEINRLADEPDETLQYRITSEISRMIDQLDLMTEQKHKTLDKVKKIQIELTQISDTLLSTLKTIRDEATSCEKTIHNAKKQKNLSNKKKSTTIYRQDQDNYEMWVPPTNQSGDGRTSLNDKLGY